MCSCCLQSYSRIPALERLGLVHQPQKPAQEPLAHPIQKDEQGNTAEQGENGEKSPRKKASATTDGSKNPFNWNIAISPDN